MNMDPNYQIKWLRAELEKLARRVRTIEQILDAKIPREHLTPAQAAALDEARREWLEWKGE